MLNVNTYNFLNEYNDDTDDEQLNMAYSAYLETDCIISLVGCRTSSKLRSSASSGYSGSSAL